MFIEASSPRINGDIARLDSAIVPYTASPVCIDFWYHMYGDDIGTLNVRLREGGVLSDVYWDRVGTRDDKWYRGQLYYVPTQDFQVGKSKHNGDGSLLSHGGRMPISVNTTGLASGIIYLHNNNNNNIHL